MTQWGSPSWATSPVSLLLSPVVCVVSLGLPQTFIQSREHFACLVNAISDFRAHAQHGVTLSSQAAAAVWSFSGLPKTTVCTDRTQRPEGDRMSGKQSLCCTTKT